MFAGHFGLAAAVKAKTPNVPLWALMLSTQLLDIVFVPLLLSGAETLEAVAGEGYGGSLIHADYTHSFVGALLLAFLAGWGAGKLWGRRGGVAVGSVVFSHWLLDLLVHRADMPLFPGNAGAFPLLGLGLWQVPTVSIVLESALVLIGAVLYYRSVASAAERSRRGWAIAAGGIMGLLLTLSLVTDVLG
ncbi:metal-dependent hydrolase [Paenibacillus ehimensis]|uniref:metal-dependent hydrolase n=1 Tax=Paenibacillus ehimensis TaxID=79264 RepID=UPI000471B211|nr:metal-dependent hydrolase [Paenibacillus ehimensis]